MTSDIAVEPASPGGDGPEVQQRDRVVIRFAGDSGDGMQLTGDRFTSETAAFGNDLSTLPNFPAEIRAPAGTLPGVSSFQLHFANYDILTPGDRPDVLVAMNPAALKANIADLPRGRHADRQHRRVQQAQPDQGRLRGQPARGRLARRAVPGAPGRDGHAHPRRAGGDRAVARRTPSGRRTCSRSACCRGCTTGRTRAPSGSCGRSSPSRPDIAEANILAFRAGHAYGETTEAFAVTYEVAPAKLAAGTYRQITGNTALAYGHRRGRAGHRAAGVPRLVPDHAGVGHPARAVQAQGLRRHHVPGRGRDRRASARRWAPRSAARSASPPRPGRASR